MTQNNEMPDEIWVFSSPESIGDLGFTVTFEKPVHTKYIRADLVESLKGENEKLKDQCESQSEWMANVVERKRIENGQDKVRTKIEPIEGLEEALEYLDIEKAIASSYDLEIMLSAARAYHKLTGDA